LECVRLDAALLFSQALSPREISAFAAIGPVPKQSGVEPHALQNAYCQITAQVRDFEFTEPGQQASILFWTDASNYILFGFEMDDAEDPMGGPALRYRLALEDAGRPASQTCMGPRASDVVWLRIARRGKTFQCFASVDGRTFEAVHPPVTWTGAPLKQVGLFATIFPVEDSSRGEHSPSFIDSNPGLETEIALFRSSQPPKNGSSQ
jgi:hypothetical protein